MKKSPILEFESFAFCADTGRGQGNYPRGFGKAPARWVGDQSRATDEVRYPEIKTAVEEYGLPWLNGYATLDQALLQPQGRFAYPRSTRICWRTWPLSDPGRSGRVTSRTVRLDAVGPRRTEGSSA